MRDMTWKSAGTGGGWSQFQCEARSLALGGIGDWLCN